MIDRAAFLRVAAVTYLLAVLGLLLCWRWIGRVHPVDVGGTLLSAGLVVCLVYLRVLANRRTQRGVQTGSARYRRIAALGSLVLAALFASAASFKILNYGAYLAAGTGLLPNWMPRGGALVVMAALPLVEVLLAALLLCTRSRRLAAQLALALLLVFTLLLLAAYRDGNLVPTCGCNWPVLEALAPARVEFMLLRNLAFLCVAALVAWASSRSGPPPGHSRSRGGNEQAEEEEPPA